MAEGRKGRRRRGFALAALVLSSVSVVVLWLAFELALRVFWPQQIEVRPVEGESAGIRDSVVGHLNRPDSYTVRRGPEYTYDARINAEGFRDRTRRTAARPPGQQRVLLLGDSFTFGAGVEYEQIWPVVFEELVKSAGRDIDVVKAGVPGFDTRKEVLYLQMLFETYRPDVVVIGFVSHDLWTAQPIETAQVGESFVDGAHAVGLVQKLATLHSVVAIKRALMQNDRLFLAKLARGGSAAFYSFPLTPAVREKVDITRELFDAAARFCREQGAALAVLSIPQEFQVVARSRGYRHANIDVEVIDRIFSDFAAERDFTWIPVLAPLADHCATTGERAYFRYDGHLNRTGNRIVGESLARRFLEILPADPG